MDEQIQQLQREVKSLRVLVDFLAKKAGTHLAVHYYHGDFEADLRKATEESERVQKEG